MYIGMHLGLLLKTTLEFTGEEYRVPPLFSAHHRSLRYTRRLPPIGQRPSESSVRSAPQATAVRLVTALILISTS